MFQPPSGGCVLKPKRAAVFTAVQYPAAFGRLCVETFKQFRSVISRLGPAAFGRLCVETDRLPELDIQTYPSRLRAAVC